MVYHFTPSCHHGIKAILLFSLLSPIQPTAAKPVLGTSTEGNELNSAGLLVGNLTYVKQYHVQLGSLTEGLTVILPQLKDSLGESLFIWLDICLLSNRNERRKMKDEKKDETTDILMKLLYVCKQWSTTRMIAIFGGIVQ